MVNNRDDGDKSGGDGDPPAGAADAAGRRKPTKEEAIAIMAASMRVLLGKDQVSELRAIKVKKSKYERPHTEAGFYDHEHAEQMARDALEISPYAKAVYFTLNP